MGAGVWGWPIWTYLWAAGVAGGGFFAAFLVNLFTRNSHKSMLRVSTVIGVPLVLIGTLLLVIDLGNPLWSWHLFVTFLPLSPMSVGSWVLLLWSVCAIVLTVLWFAEDYEPAKGQHNLLSSAVSWLRPLVRLSGVLGWFAFGLAVLLISYTGVLLTTTSRSMWATMLLPGLFVVSAVATGLAANVLAHVLLRRKIAHEFCRAGVFLCVLEAAVLIAFLASVPSAVLLGGPLSWWFWIGVALVGLLIPFVLDAFSSRAARIAPLVLASTTGVLLGGLVLRAVIVIGGQM